MENSFKDLHGIRGFLIFLNHPIREPVFKEGSILEMEYERLKEEAFKEVFPETLSIKN